ncbi:serum amyloid A-5 protein-like [Palaemon carinicauda]|uniref:serum amyloid A-5 protein-like n=1 Tax=Palaemon carinicauda TaxID=392227 RepID=UPI0035B617B1
MLSKQLDFCYTGGQKVEIRYKMKLFIIIVVFAAIAARTEGASGFWRSIADSSPVRFGKEAIQGASVMFDAYSDMRKANWRNSDKYFHARGNYDAARRGPGGAWASRVLSNGKERFDQWRGGSSAGRAADQAANHWGRNGGDPNIYRPLGIPFNY